MLTAPATDEVVETVDDQIGADWAKIQEKYAVHEEPAEKIESEVGTQGPYGSEVYGTSG